MEGGGGDLTNKQLSLATCVQDAAKTTTAPLFSGCRRDGAVLYGRKSWLWKYGVDNPTTAGGGAIGLYLRWEVGTAALLLVFL